MVHLRRANRANRVRSMLVPVSSAYVEAYWTPGGKTSKPKRRYRVRCRTRTSASPLLHLGSFHTRTEAEDRAKWARALLAKGIVPNVATNLFAPEETPGITVKAAVKRYIDQRVDLADTTRRSYRSLAPRINKQLGKYSVHAVTPNDVRELIAACIADGLSPAPIRSIRGILAGALDYAHIAPNPARDRTIKVPGHPSERVDVPPTQHVVAILEHVPPSLQLAVALLEATGARVSELCRVEHGDVDYERCTLRLVGKGDKVRVVPVPEELARRLPAVPAADRAGAGRLWRHVTPHGMRRALKSACQEAGIPEYTPHDLRHRFASRLVHQGVPVTQISLWMGHSRTSITHDIYSDVIADGEEAWRLVMHE